jgi:ketosteroid isomerase-like protein
MAEQENVQAVQQIFGLMREGKIDELLNLFTDDAVWSEPGPSDVLPTAGAFQGRGGLKELFGRMGAGDTEPVGGFTPPQTVSQGDRVIMLGHRGARVKATDRSWEDDWVLAFTFEGPKIKTVQAYNDTAARIAAYKGS